MSPCASQASVPSLTPDPDDSSRQSIPPVLTHRIFDGVLTFIQPAEAIRFTFKDEHQVYIRNCGWSIYWLQFDDGDESDTLPTPEAYEERCVFGFIEKFTEVSKVHYAQSLINQQTMIVWLAMVRLSYYFTWSARISDF